MNLEFFEFNQHLIFLNLLSHHKHTIAQHKNCTWVSLSTKFPKIVRWLIYAEICSRTPVFVPFRHNFGKKLLYLTYFQLFYQKNFTCNAIFCLTSCRTRCQVQSAVFKSYSYCINGLNFAPQLYRNTVTHAYIYYSCLSVCHRISFAFSLRWVRLLNFAVAKPPRLLDSYGLGAVISLLRPSQNKESPKFKCFHWCMTELTMCLLRATRLKTRAWILLIFLPWSLLELYHLNFINNKIQTCLVHTAVSKWRQWCILTDTVQCLAWMAAGSVWRRSPPVVWWRHGG